MKLFVKELVEKIASYLSPFKRLLFISLAAWIIHACLRAFLLFRVNPYGFPFVSKPDWYIFHAICFDFIWICNALVIFAIIGGALNRLTNGKKINLKISTIVTVIYAAFHSVLLFLTYLDHELLRFLGCHLSIGLVSTYKDTSSVMMFGDYSANDNSIPFIHFFIFALLLPATYGVYRFIKSRKFSLKKCIISMLCFYVASYAFVNFIWTGNARATKLRPVIALLYNEIFESHKKNEISNEQLQQFAKTYQNLWQKVEGDSLWHFSSEGPGDKMPLYRIPSQELLQSEKLQAQRLQKPNFILVFMESHRGMNVGFLNPDLKPSPTPYYDSIATYSRIWERMHTSGLPTTGGVLSTHIGIPHHSTLAQATDLAHVTLPSFASVLTDSGYTTHYFSAADPAWDNLGVWMSKWYSAQHYDRNHEDDSTFFDHAISYVNDTLAKQEKPFLATLMTRSNHYPFNFAAGMSDEEKQKPHTERIKYTMNYADRQLARFMRSIEKKDWFQNTYVIIMADHGFPLGENGISTMNGGGFSNATWIPFLIYGKGIEVGRDTATAAQIDIAPTILELAGIAVPNIFMGHNLLRGYGEGLSLGAYLNAAAVGYNGLRLIEKYPLGNHDVDGLFAEEDTHQKNNLAESLVEEARKHTELLDSLIRLSDYTLEKGI